MKYLWVGEKEQSRQDFDSIFSYQSGEEDVAIAKSYNGGWNQPDVNWEDKEKHRLVKGFHTMIEAGWYAMIQV